MGGDGTTTEKADPDWDYFVQIIELKDEQRKALEEEEITALEDFLEVGNDPDLFDFDDKNDPKLFHTSTRKKLRRAWEWLDVHKVDLDQDDGSTWFKSEFQKSFRKKLRRQKRAAEALLADEEAKRYKTTEPNQANASSFTGGGSRTMQGVATMPPIFHDHLVPQHVKEHFTSKFEAIPNKDEEVIIEELSSAFLLDGTPYSLKSVPETSKDPSLRTVQTDHLDLIAKKFHRQVTTARMFNDGIDKSTRRTLAEIGLTGGISTMGSFPEAYFHTGPLAQLTGSPVNFMVTSIFECKDTAASPDSGHGEGIANATNAAMAMATIGIPRERIIVPVFSTTGSLVQVAAVYMLEPSLPTVCFVTPLLRMSEEEERLKAAKILIAMSHHRNELEQYVATNSPTRVDGMTMRLENEKYHFKLLCDFFSCCGQNAVGQSLTRMLEVTKQLANTPYACLPIAVRLKDAACKYDAILFQRLVDYCIGLPHDATDRHALVSEMERIVTDMHEKGVIHMDLYLSNFMWKKESDGTFSVKIIDFDAAHKLGEKLTQATWSRYLEIKSSFAALGNRATLEHDNLFMKMLRQKINEESLRVAGPFESEKEMKSRLDGACTALMEDIFAAVNVVQST